MIVEMTGIIGSHKMIKGWGAGLSVHNDRYILKKFKEVTGNEMSYYHFGGIGEKNHLSSVENYNQIMHIRNSNKPFIVGEYTPFRQIPNYKKIGWNSYDYKNGIFNNLNVDNSRWKKFSKKNNLSIKEWSSPGDYILILGQLEYDSALNSLYQQGYNSFYDWVDNLINNIGKYSDRPIIIRPHPKQYNTEFLEKKFCKYKNVAISKNLNKNYEETKSGGQSLLDDLNRSYCVISYSSNSTVEAVCKGIPVFLFDEGAAAYKISQNSLSCIEELNYSIEIDRWINSIVYSIWNYEEVRKGEAWNHLKPIYFS